MHAHAHTRTPIKDTPTRQRGVHERRRPGLQETGMIEVFKGRKRQDGSLAGGLESRRGSQRLENKFKNKALLLSEPWRSSGGAGAAAALKKHVYFSFKEPGISEEPSGTGKPQQAPRTTGSAFPVHPVQRFTKCGSRTGTAGPPKKLLERLIFRPLPRSAQEAGKPAPSPLFPPRGLSLGWSGGCLPPGQCLPPRYGWGWGMGPARG